MLKPATAAVVGPSQATEAVVGPPRATEAVVGPPRATEAVAVRGGAEVAVGYRACEQELHNDVRCAHRLGEAMEAAAVARLAAAVATSSPAIAATAAVAVHPASAAGRTTGIRWQVIARGCESLVIHKWWAIFNQSRRS